jgi:hypothetical protein
VSTEYLVYWRTGHLGGWSRRVGCITYTQMYGVTVSRLMIWHLCTSRSVRLIFIYSVVYLTMLSMTETIYRRFTGSLVNITLERVCIETGVALFEVLDG